MTLLFYYLQSLFTGLNINWYFEKVYKSSLYLTLTIYYNTGKLNKALKPCTNQVQSRLYKKQKSQQYVSFKYKILLVKPNQNDFTAYDYFYDSKLRVHETGSFLNHDFSLGRLHKLRHGFEETVGSLSCALHANHLTIINPMTSPLTQN